MASQKTQELRVAIAAHQAGELEKAAQLYRKVISSDDRNAQALFLFSTLRLQQNQTDDAEKLLNKAIAIAGLRPELQLNRGLIYMRSGSNLLAAQDFQEVCHLQPQNFMAWMNLALASKSLGDYPSASKALRNALIIRPDNIQASLELVIVDLQLDRPVYRPIRSATLRHIADHLSMANEILGLLAKHELDNEKPEFSKAVFEALSDYPDKQLEWLRILKTQGQLATVIELFQTLPSAQGDSPEVKLLIASCLLSIGRYQESIAHYQNLLEIRPDFWQAHSNYLIALQHDPSVDATALLSAHKEWADQHSLVADFACPTEVSNNPIRIGWITPRLLSGPMRTFFLGVLQSFPRKEAEHWLYSTHPARDTSSDLFEEAAGQFADLSDKSEDEIVERLRADNLTIAVELSGHGPHHSLRVMSRRVAPIQCSWLDYFHPTEVLEIDFFISDNVLSEGAPRGRQKFIDLVDGRLCADFSDFSITPDPCSSSTIRFGCFNRISKLSDELLRAWAQLLEINSESELELRSLYFRDRETRTQWANRASSLGLPIDRLKMIGWSSWEETLKAYRNIDVALDSYPFSGCATSADALYMGVPVITMMGRTLVGRQTASLLKHAGFDDWIANDLTEYVRIASNTALSGTRSNGLRQSIREQFLARQSKVKLFASNLEKSLISLSKSVDQEN